MVNGANKLEKTRKVNLFIQMNFISIIIYLVHKKDIQNNKTKTKIILSSRKTVKLK